MPSFGFDTDRISLWKWCRCKGAGHDGSGFTATQEDPTKNNLLAKGEKPSQF